MQNLKDSVSLLFIEVLNFIIKSYLILIHEINSNHILFINLLYWLLIP